MPNINGNTFPDQKKVAHNKPVYWYDLKNIVYLLTECVNWINNSSGGGGTVSVQDASPTTGQTVVSDGSNLLVLTPAGTLATLTIDFPSSPVNGQLFSINSSQQITLLTLSSSADIQNYSTPFLLLPGTIQYVYNLSNTTWIQNF